MKNFILFALITASTQAQAFIFKCDQGVIVNLGSNLAEVSFENEDTVVSGKITKSTKNEVIYAMDSWIDSSGQVFDSATMYVSMKLIKKEAGLITVLANYEGTTFPFEYQCSSKK